MFFYFLLDFLVEMQLDLELQFLVLWKHTMDSWLQRLCIINMILTQYFQKTESFAFHCACQMDPCWPRTQTHFRSQVSFTKQNFKLFLLIHDFPKSMISRRIILLIVTLLSCNKQNIASLFSLFIFRVQSLTIAYSLLDTHGHKFVILTLVIIWFWIKDQKTSIIKSDS